MVAYFRRVLRKKIILPLLEAQRALVYSVITNKYMGQRGF